MINIPTKNIKNIILFIFLITGLSGISQDLPDKVFYKHFEGNINKNLHLSLNLIKAADSLYGNYYHWYIEHEGAAKPEFTGPQIPLEGKMLSPNEFILKEYGEKESYFEGIFVGGNRLEGTWKDKETGKELPFELYEKYPKGSMQFTAMLKEAFEQLIEDTVAPNAKLKLLLIEPHKYSNKSIADSVKAILFSFVDKDSGLSENLSQLAEKTSNKFFSSYHEANKDLHELGHAFNWEKIVLPEVLFNEDYFLSIGMINYAYTGGAHGLQVNKYFVFDMTDGNRVKLDDILQTGFKPKLDSLLNTELRIKYSIPKGNTLTQQGFFMDSITYTNNFYLNKSGINFHYNSYEIAPYSWGHVDLLVPYHLIKEILKNEGMAERLFKR